MRISDIKARSSGHWFENTRGRNKTLPRVYGDRYWIEEQRFHDEEADVWHEVYRVCFQFSNTGGTPERCNYFGGDWTLVQARSVCSVLAAVEKGERRPSKTDLMEVSRALYENGETYVSHASSGEDGFFRDTLFIERRPDGALKIFNALEDPIEPTVYLEWGRASEWQHHNFGQRPKFFYDAHLLVDR